MLIKLSTCACRDENAGRSHSTKNDNSVFEREEELKYLGTTLTNQNSIQEKNKRRLKSCNVCCHSVKNFCLQVRYSKILISKQQIYSFACCLYGCETWSFTLRE